MCRYASALELSHAQTAELAALLRGHVPPVADAAIGEVERQLPALLRPRDLHYAEFVGQAVRRGIGYFVEHMLDGDGRIEGLRDYFRDVGALAAQENIDQDACSLAFRVSAGVAISGLTEAVESFPAVTPTTVALVVQDVLSYLDEITKAMAEGYASAWQPPDIIQLRRKLLELLADDEPRTEDIRRLAEEAGWRVPRTIAAVALAPRPRAALRPAALPAEALAGTHLPDPYLIIPDPDGPGRRAAIEAELRDWAAAIGPTVPVTQAARSLRSARRTLELAAHLELDTATPIRSQDHTLTLVLLHGQEMMNDLVDHLLAPLDTFRGHSRRQRLCQTLLMCLQCGFNAAEVAARLHLHPQTIRYRIRQLEEAFGPSIHDPTRNLDYQAALTYWSLTVDPATADDQAGYNGAGSTAGNGSGHATPGSRWPE